MVFSFGAGQQLRDIVVAESLAQSHGPRNCAIGLGWRRIQDRIQSEPQGFVDDFFNRLIELFGAPLHLRRNIRIQRQCGSHTGIMMSSLSMSRCIICEYGMPPSGRSIACSIREPCGAEFYAMGIPDPNQPVEEQGFKYSFCHGTRIGQ